MVSLPPSYPLLLPRPLWPPVFEYLPWLDRCFEVAAAVVGAGFGCVVSDSFVVVGGVAGALDVPGVAGVPVFGSFVVVGGGPSPFGYPLWYVWTAVHGPFVLAPFSRLGGLCSGHLSWVKSLSLFSGLILL